jgi:hypothetical protein
MDGGAQSTFIINASRPSIAPQEDVDGSYNGMRARPVSTSIYCLPASVAHVGSFPSPKQPLQPRSKSGYSPCSRLPSMALRRLVTHLGFRDVHSIHRDPLNE